MIKYHLYCVKINLASVVKKLSKSLVPKMIHFQQITAQTSNYIIIGSRIASFNKLRYLNKLKYIL